MKLTDRKRAILTFIAEYTAREGYPPSIREIGKAAGLRSENSVSLHIWTLVARGLLHAEPTQGRTVRLADTVKVWPGDAITRTVLVSRCPGCDIDHPDDLDCLPAVAAAANPIMEGR